MKLTRGNPSGLPAIFVVFGLTLLIACTMIKGAGAASIQAPVDLGTAEAFAVLGGAAVTNTGTTVVNGDLGVSPGSAITGFPPGIVDGTIHNTDAAAAQAQSDLVIAYNDAAGRAPNAVLTGQNLGGLTLTEGAYRFAEAALLTGT